MAYKDINRAKEYQMNWQHQNPEKVREYTRQWRLLNPDKVKQGQIQLNKNKREKYATDIEYKNKCKEQARQSNKRRTKKIKQYRIDNKDHISICHKKYRINQRNLWIDFFASINFITCSQCGYNKCFAAVDFHHINPDIKLISIADYICIHPCNIKHMDIIKQELKNCIPLCRNCHAELHNVVMEIING